MAAAGAPPVRLEAYRPNRADLRALIDLAVPIAVVQVGMMAMGALDTVMLGHVSATDLASVAIGNLYFFGIAVFGMGVLFALDPVISQAVGAVDAVAVARGVQRGGVLAVGLSLLAMALLLPAEAFLTWARQPADVIPVAGGYALGMIPGVLPFYGFVVLRQSLQAMGRVRAILITVIAANGVNLLLNWALIFGHLGFEPHGAVGSAWGTSASRWFMMLSLAVLGWSELAPAIRPLRRDAWAPKPLLRILRVGTPIGAAQWLEFGVFGASGLLLGLMGTLAVASHQVALQLAALTFMIPVGVAQAASVVVGQCVGRGDPHGARRGVGAALLVGVGFMTVTAVIFLTVPGPLARTFSSDVAVVAAAASLLPIAGVFQVFDGIQVVAAGALRGVGDTRVPMVLTLVGFWFVGLPIGAVLGFRAGWGAQGVWWGLALGIGVVAMLLSRRIVRRFGRELRRLVIDDDALPG